MQESLGWTSFSFSWANTAIERDREWNCLFCSTLSLSIFQASFFQSKLYPLLDFPAMNGSLPSVFLCRWNLFLSLSPLFLEGKTISLPFTPYHSVSSSIHHFISSKQSLASQSSIVWETKENELRRYKLTRNVNREEDNHKQSMKTLLNYLHFLNSNQALHIHSHNSHEY